MMVVLIIVAVACFTAGTFAATRWLPDLESGPVGGIAFFVVCGLCGAVLALLGINVDSIVRELQESGGFGGLRTNTRLETSILSQGLLSIMRDCGTVGALTLIAYLLASKQSIPQDPAGGDAPAAASIST
jgi:hypothetical protein